MAVDPDIAAMMNDSVTLAAPTGTSRAGEKTYGAGTAYPCQVSGSKKQFRTAAGQNMVGVRQVIFDRVVTVTPEYKITLPDGSTPPIAETEIVPGEDGEEFTVVYTGAASSIAQRA